MIYVVEVAEPGSRVLHPELVLHRPGRPDHVAGGGGYPQNLRPHWELLHHHTGRIGTVHQGGKVDRGLLADDREIATEWNEMTEIRM